MCLQLAWTPIVSFQHYSTAAPFIISLPDELGSIVVVAGVIVVVAGVIVVVAGVIVVVAGVIVVGADVIVVVVVTVVVVIIGFILVVVVVVDVVVVVFVVVDVVVVVVVVVLRGLVCRDECFDGEVQSLLLHTFSFRASSHCSLQQQWLHTQDL